MSVQLNFKNLSDNKQLVLKRIINQNGVCEYFVNDQPLLAEEYLYKINGELQLNINHFCAYQGKLEELCFTQSTSGEGHHLSQVFEELSGSYLLKPQHQEFKSKLSDLEARLKNDSEAL